MQTPAPIPLCQARLLWPAATQAPGAAQGHAALPPGAVPPMQRDIDTSPRSSAQHRMLRELRDRTDGTTLQGLGQALADQGISAADVKIMLSQGRARGWIDSYVCTGQVRHGLTAAGRDVLADLPLPAAPRNSAAGAAATPAIARRAAENSGSQQALCGGTDCATPGVPRTWRGVVAGESAETELLSLGRALLRQARDQFRAAAPPSDKSRLLRGHPDTHGRMTPAHPLGGAICQLAERRAPLQACVTQRVANAEKMAMMATAEARDRGMQADVWAFDHRIAGPGHMVAVIGQAGSATRSRAPGPVLDHADDISCWTHAVVVDPWVGLCCPAPEYRAAFLAGMQQWRIDDRRVWLETAAYPGDVIGWLPATAPEWLERTIYAPLTRMNLQSSAPDPHLSPLPLARPGAYA